MKKRRRRRMAVEGVPKFVVDESADTDRREQESDETKARLELAGEVPVGTGRIRGQWAVPPAQPTCDERAPTPAKPRPCHSILILRPVISTNARCSRRRQLGLAACRGVLATYYLYMAIHVQTQTYAAWIEPVPSRPTTQQQKSHDAS
ncbi:hypothetical protein J3E74DRAFT_475752 [Bipolaris maydis]|nr:hypothetical protein J3E74DRAFT_475752 [Bipolaris maydis]